MNNKKILLSLQDIKMYFPIKKNLNLIEKKEYSKAVDGVSLNIYENETLGLVGESGSGKSTLGKVILQLYNNSSGRVLFNDINLSSLSKKDMRELRKDLQIVFQDPYSSLNPRLTIFQIISEGLIAHKIYKKDSKELKEYVLEIMEKCGLQPYMQNRYPHQFSGGQRQRISIARALSLNPKFMICDEAVSTLDVSIQSQIINLLLDLKEENNLTYLFISHDLSVVRFIADRIAVMYLGSIVEIASAEDIFINPSHPYTKALIDAIPYVTDAPKTQKEILTGDIESSINPPSGCKFHTRCKFHFDRCKNEVPVLKEYNNEHFIACHRFEMEDK